MFCMILGGLCPSRNVGEGGKSGEQDDSYDLKDPIKEHHPA
jgi:hypothetical protein